MSRHDPSTGRAPGMPEEAMLEAEMPLSELPERAEPETEVSPRDVAVIGLSGRFPGAADLDQLWRNLETGKEAVRFLSDDELLASGVPRELFERPGYVRAASHLEGADRFDAEFFGYSAREAALLDPQQRLFLEHAWTALENAGTAPAAFEGLIGVYAGVAWNTYLLSNLITHPELFDGSGAFQLFIANDKDFMPTRVSYKLNLRGPSLLVQTSCSTSLVATHLACLGLQSYECDLALVGGVTVKVPSLAGYLYEEGGLASPDGHCRAFDARAAGTIFGSGVGVVVLKRLAEALADGDRIRAVIKGSAINNDGSAKVSYTAPSVQGQAEVIAAAQEMAGVDPTTLGYVECHGTGTSLGDPIEVRALTKAFRQSTDDTGFCALGSIKSNFGHLDAAAGVAGLIKTILALEHRRIPPSLHFEQPNPALDLDRSPFFIAAEARPWEPLGGSARRGGVSSFGVGGTNAHVVLEEAPARPASGPSRRWQGLWLSARSEAALEAASDNLRAWLEAPANRAVPLADVAYTLRVGRSDFRHRRLVLARDRDEAVAALAGRRPELGHAAVDSDEPRPRPVAFLFSGQGSQYPGMGRGLYRDEPLFRAVVDRCAGALEPELELDLRDLLWPRGDGDGEGQPEPDAEGQGDGEEIRDSRLGRTRFTQPALLVLELALAELWRSWGVEPQALLGHSLGEYAAAVVAGVMSEGDALRLVAARGRLMEALPEGAMLAVPLAAERLAARLAGHPELAIAARNEPERSVVSGPEAALAVFEAELVEAGLEARRLHTSHAFHSAMMEPVVEPLTALAAELPLRNPAIPLLSNVTGTWITEADATDPAYWGRRHVLATVRFADALATLLDEPERVLVEVGPGRALATLAGRHPARQPGQPVLTSLRHPREEARDEGEDQARMLASLGRLWLAGVALSPARPFAGERRQRVSLPTYPFERQSYWIAAGTDRAPAAGAAASPAASLAAASPAAAGEVAKRADLASWFYLPSWRPTLAPWPAGSREPALEGSRAASGEPGATAESWLLLGQPGGAIELLAEPLRAAGRRPIVARPGEPGAGPRQLGEDRWELDPTSRGDFQALLAALDAEGAAPGVVVHGWALTGALDGPPVADAIAFERAQRLGFHSLLALAQALATAPATNGSELTLAVVADGVEQVTAGEPLRPEKAPLLGLCRVIPQEIPALRCRVIDVAPPAAPFVAGAGTGTEEGAAWARRLLAELASGAEDDLVAYRAGQRWVEAFEPVRLEASPNGPDEKPSHRPPLRQGGVYLLTGGLRGNGHALALWLAESCSARLALVHGEPLTEDDHQRLAELRAAGSEVLPLAVEAGNTAGWTAALTAVAERFGALDGLVHAAGPQGESTFRVLTEIDADHVGAHFRSKIHDLLALEEALAAVRSAGVLPADPELCLLLSSLASLLGGVAYGAYAAANRFLDAFARDRRRRGGLPWRAVGWDVLQLDGEERQITELRADLAALAMSRDEGREALGRLLARDAALILVSTADLDARRRRVTAPRLAARPLGARHPRPSLSVPYAPPEGELEARIAAIWGELLGFDGVGADDNFFDLGGDSFIAVRVAARLNEELESRVPVAQIYQRLTVRSLAELLGQDEAAAVEERGRHLAERRQSAEQRRALRQRRRGRAKVEVSG